MAIIDFPEHPTHGQSHTCPDGQCWQYDGMRELWTSQGIRHRVSCRTTDERFTGDVAVGDQILSFVNGILKSVS